MNHKLIYLPVSFLVVISIVGITYEMPHFSRMTGFLAILFVALGMAVLIASIVYLSNRNTMDGENLYIGTGSGLLFGFVCAFAIFSYLNRHYATYHCQSASFTVLSYQGRYSAAHGRIDGEEIVANQWILTIYKDGAERRFVLDRDIFEGDQVTKAVSLEFCKGILHTEYLKLPE